MITSIIFQGGPFNKHRAECYGDPVFELSLPCQHKESGEVVWVRYALIEDKDGVGYYEYVEKIPLEEML